MGTLPMNSCAQIILRKITDPMCNFKIMEFITDMIVNSIVDNIQLKLLSGVVCMEIKNP